MRWVLRGNFAVQPQQIEFDENSEKITSQKEGKINLFKNILPSKTYT